MRRITTTLLTAAALAAATPAGAVAVVDFEARSSINHFYWFGGFAISGDEGHDGAPLPPAGPPWEGVWVTDPAPATLAIAGSAYKELAYLFWAGYLAETWDQAQTYGFGASADGVRFTSSGHATITQDSIICSDITGCGLATESHRSTNIQHLEFSLSEANAYELAGSASGGQWVDLLKWDPLGSRWFHVVHGPTQTSNREFELGGLLQAGLYRLSNYNGTFSEGGPDQCLGLHLRPAGRDHARGARADPGRALAGGAGRLGADPARAARRRMIHHAPGTEAAMHRYSGRKLG